MALNSELPLHEAVLLLALRDDTGTPAASMYTYAVAGGVLAELLLADRLRLASRRRGRPLVECYGTAMVDDPVLDDALRRIRTARRRGTAATTAAITAAIT